jgi:hypothetical protein
LAIHWIGFVDCLRGGTRLRCLDRVQPQVVVELTLMFDHKSTTAGQANRHYAM